MINKSVKSIFALTNCSKTLKALLAALVIALSSYTGSAQTLSLYGGEKHDVYLGCYNCGKYDSKSIWNDIGDYGSKYKTESIWNSSGTYGSKYSNFSPFYDNASYPPVLKDENGKFYAYFTANKYKSQCLETKAALAIYEYWDLIPNDLSKWYDKLFKW